MDVSVRAKVYVGVWGRVKAKATAPTSSSLREKESVRGGEIGNE